MSLVDRYLHAVGRHLPADKEEDILAELRDDIQARIDERASALGRPLTEDEEAELLKGYGRPVLMASRYRKPRQLVGPNLFPFYLATLQIAIAVAFVANVAISVFLALAGRPTGGLVSRVVEFPTGTAVTVFGWVTLVFGAMEWVSSQQKFKDNWDPRKLPRIPASRLPRPSRVGTAIELFFDALFVVFWVWLYRSGGSFSLPPLIALAPAWSQFYLPVLTIVLASMTVTCVTLIRPDLTAFRIASGVVLTIAGVSVATLLLRTGPLLVPGESGIEAAELAQILDGLLRWSIAVGVLITIIQTSSEAWRWLRPRGTAVASR